MTPEWPPYAIGPRESLFALGVVSTKYAELESILSFLFSTIFDLSSDDALMIIARIGNEAAAILIKQKLPSVEWLDNAEGAEAKESVSHFLKGFNACTENRAALSHSMLAWTGATGQTVLFKTTKSGKTHAVSPTREELREIADAMNLYAEYGRTLGNAINLRFRAGKPPPFPISAFPWPGKPPLPRTLEYTGDAIALRP